MKNIAPLDKLKRVQLLLLDVDGVLTDGSIIYHDDGSETKIFNARDGFGLRLVIRAGIKVGIVTGRSSRALRHRCENLGIENLFDGITDKAGVLEEIAVQTGINPANTAFVGDDLPDLPIMKRAGLSIAVADAHQRVRQKADWTTRAGGGPRRRKGGLRSAADRPGALGRNNCALLGCLNQILRIILAINLRP